MSKESLVTETLKKMKSDDDNSYNLYEHFNQLLTQLPIKSDNLDNLKQFSRISQCLKVTHLNLKQLHSESQVKQKVNSSPKYPEWVERQSKIINKSKTINKTHQSSIQNFQKSNSLMREIGIDFGDRNSLQLNCLMKIIGEKFKMMQVRFWGKILATNSDYYVIQGICDKKYPPEAQQSTQKYRTGVNYYSYLVSNSLISEEWMELPLVTPEQIIASRKIKYIFTGNPNASLKSYPAFPGQQKHLLKAQLARITHNCQIAPKGLYSPLEDNPDEIGYSEEFKFPQFAQLSNLENWVHLNPFILNIGRSSYYVNPKLPQDQKEQILTKLAETDPKIERLKGINEDKMVEKMGFEGSWICRQHGNPQIFNNVGKEEGSTSCYGVISLRNVNWPGWTTVANGKGYASIYIGYGYKATQASFSPLGPDDLLVEGEDIEEFHEPNPKNPPDQLQPDSDQQNKKPQQ